MHGGGGSVGGERPRITQREHTFVTASNSQGAWGGLYNFRNKQKYEINLRPVKKGLLVMTMEYQRQETGSGTSQNKPKQSPVMMKEIFLLCCKICFRKCAVSLKWMN